MTPRTEAEMLNRMAAYCSGCERCLFDVRQKLAATDLDPEACTRILNRLVEEKFIDEARYAQSFVNDKLRFNHWGRIKISGELRRKHLPATCIAEALGAIDETEYQTILRNLLKQKARSVKGKDNRDTTNRLIRFAAGRGFTLRETIACLQLAGLEPDDEDTYGYDDNPE